jgi:hypothetical protein
MGAPSDLAPWASDVRLRQGKCLVTLRRGLDLNGVLNLLKTQDVSMIRSLRVPGSVGLSGLRAIATCRQFRSLTSLALSAFADGDDAADVVFETQLMSKLRVLKVWGVSDAIDMRLARGDFVDSLRQLEIRSSPELSSLDRYFAGKRIGALQFIQINGTGLADASKLFENPACTNLASISLARCEYGADSIDALISSRGLTHLRRLNLSYPREREGIQAIRRLLQSRTVTGVETLTLCGCQLDGYDWSRVKLPALRILDLRDNGIDTDEVTDILNARGLPNLQQLIVSTPESAIPRKYDRRLVVDDRRPSFR